eukprot:TRINITY_DN39720_c0_g1_i1.p1 TRINITY_DN39720_c0_g1~~TRINITY_DN39720_c0_g1_i1.p1  ORF type:complete len:318 (+),score=46.95 TRINITY_DN39720_c0_g1_i1:90-1043(+)
MPRCISRSRSPHKHRADSDDMSDIGRRDRCGSASSWTTEALDGGEDCAVCYEPLSERGGPVVLPCACRTSYCLSCWDRSLAVSVASSGAARCPSCRSAMEVDFDPAHRTLRFSCLPPMPTDDGGKAAQQATQRWRERLFKKALPVQIRLLRDYGRRACSGAGGLDKESGSTEDAARVLQHDAGCLAAEQKDLTKCVVDSPGCVCGGHLQHVGVRERVLAFVAETTSISSPETVIDRLIETPPLVCDICDRMITKNESVWTCENGQTTIMHAGSYDVCEQCFSKHALSRAGPAANSLPSPKGHNRSKALDAKANLEGR